VRGEAVECFLADAINAMRRAEPQVAARVAKNAVDAFGQTRGFGRDAGEMAVLVAVEAAALGGDPERALRILIKRGDNVAGEAIGGCEVLEFSVAQPGETAQRGNPQGMVAAVLPVPGAASDCGPVVLSCLMSLACRVAAARSTMGASARTMGWAASAS